MRWHGHAENFALVRRVRKRPAKARKKLKMDHADMAEVHIAAPSFVKAVRMVRASLTRAGLSIVSDAENAQGRVLCVACPLLILETLAFHRPASVFVPVHVGIRPVPH